MNRLRSFIESKENFLNDIQQDTASSQVQYPCPRSFCWSFGDISDWLLFFFAFKDILKGPCFLLSKNILSRNLFIFHNNHFFLPYLFLE